MEFISRNIDDEQNIDLSDNLSDISENSFSSESRPKPSSLPIQILSLDEVSYDRDLRVIWLFNLLYDFFFFSNSYIFNFFYKLFSK